MASKKMDVCLFNAFKTYDEAEAHRHKLQDPDDYGIVTMIGREQDELHNIMLKDAIREIQKVYDLGDDDGE